MRIVATLPNGKVDEKFDSAAELCDVLSRWLLLTPTNLQGRDVTWTVEAEQTP